MAGPYRSKKRTNVYHTYQNCTKGNNIEKKNRVPGKGGKSLCKECKNRGRKKR